MSIVVSEQAGDLIVAFPFDPRIIAAVKALPARKWDPGAKRWRLPSSLTSYDALVAMASSLGEPLSMHPMLVARFAKERTELEKARLIVAADDAFVTDFTFRTEPYAHQRAGFDFLRHLKSGGLLWEMGLGKTKTAIDYCEWLHLFSTTGEIRVLVITPNSVIGNWGREIEKHAGHDDYILLQAPLTLVRRATLMATKRYTIVNTEAMSLGPTTRAILARTWDVVIVDESHRFKNPRASRTKSLLKVKAKRRLILSGTPLTNSPEDLWAQATFVQPGILGSWWSFRDRYLVIEPRFKNIVGMKPGAAEQLRDTLGTIAYRRTKAEVLDLPPKVYEDRSVGLSERQAAAYRSMQETLRMSIPETGDSIVAHSILTQLLRLTQVTAGMIGQGDQYLWDSENPKLKEIDDLVSDDLRGEQVVIFGVYRYELERLARHFASPLRYDDPKADLPIIYGGVPPARRTELVDDFQRGARRLLFVQAHSGGIGINLTAAQYAIYYTRGWSLEDYQQSQDRLHRIGQRGTVTVLHLVAKGTIDEDIAKALAAKRDLAARLTGDEARAIAADVLRRKV